jgi:hypothetical protein
MGQGKKEDTVKGIICKFISSVNDDNIVIFCIKYLISDTRFTSTSHPYNELRLQFFK